MKKLFLFIVAAIVTTTTSFAQSSMLATLSHDGTISTYYGPSALKDAYDAATNGDIITLSSGSFNAVNIEKAVTIRGAGMAIDKTAQTEPTVIAGDFNINIPEDVNERLTLEGIYHNHKITTIGTLKNATFLKDRFQEFTSGNGTVSNLTMIHCRVASNWALVGNCSASFVNCIIKNPNMGNSTNAEYVNCVVIKSSLFFQENLAYSQFKNCILIPQKEGSDNYLPSACVSYNCVVTSNTNHVYYWPNFLRNIPNTTNSTKATITDVFKTFKGTYNDNESFELIDAAKESMKGIDGTEVGIYGGNMPFSTTPTNPQITKCNVAAKSTADGKLSVDITVSGAE